MKLKRRKTDRGFLYLIWCPACQEQHAFDVSPGEWEFDGDWENPTFSPSLNIRGKCHFILRKGVMEFCGDCKHHMNNKDVPLPDWPEE